MTELSCTLIRSDRKTIAIQITAEGEILLRCPRRLSEKQARDFLAQKRPWIEKNLARIQAVPQLPPFTEEELQTLAKTLSPLLKRRLDYFAPLVGVTYGRVTIRSQRTRWGSCSARGNLNFNCLLSLVPPEVLDYIVVHELCHRKELNHSPLFWAEVAKVLPDYKSREAWLKDNGPALIRRLPKG